MDSKRVVTWLLLVTDACLSFLNDTPDGIRFVAMGDWGGISFHPWTTPVQTSVAEQMVALARTRGLDFTVLLGDNFYLYGVGSVDDPRFQDTFEKVYSDQSLQRPWYVIAGNHDYFGNVSAQIAYSKRSSRWIFPDYYHIVRRAIPGGRSLEILMIDTIQLCGNVYAMGVQPAGPDNVQAAERQWIWIEEQLNKSNADYLLIAGHFPVFSVAEHGSTDCLQHRLEPLLYRYHVTAYLAGHDHNMQHLRVTKGDHTVHYVIAGAANFVEDSQSHVDTVPKDALQFYWAEMLYLGGLSFFEVTNNNATVSFVDGIGNTRHSFTMHARY